MGRTLHTKCEGYLQHFRFQLSVVFPFEFLWFVSVRVAVAAVVHVQVRRRRYRSVCKFGIAVLLRESRIENEEPGWLSDNKSLLLIAWCF